MENPPCVYKNLIYSADCAVERLDKRSLGFFSGVEVMVGGWEAAKRQQADRRKRGDQAEKSCFAGLSTCRSL